MRRSNWYILSLGNIIVMAACIKEKSFYIKIWNIWMIEI
jgi:hypothetical protein